MHFFLFSPFSYFLIWIISGKDSFTFFVTLTLTISSSSIYELGSKLLMSIDIPHQEVCQTPVVYMAQITNPHGVFIRITSDGSVVTH